MASASPHRLESVPAAAPASVSSTTLSSRSMALRRQTALAESSEDIVYGSLSGIVGKYFEYPFDTVKVRLQSQPDHLPLRYTGPLDCFRQSIRAEGALSLYRGISAPLVGAAIENSCLFFFERLGRHAVHAAGIYPRDEALPLSALFATGSFSGVCTSFVLTPVELVKCRIQAPSLLEAAGTAAAATAGTALSSSGATVAAAAPTVAAAPTQPQRLTPLPVIRDIFQRQGLRGFWIGQTGTLIREAGGCAAWFGSKETATALFRKSNERRAVSRAATITTGTSTTANVADSAALLEAELERLRAEPLPLWQQAVAGASAGVSYNFLFFPADTVKSRMQTSPMAAARGGGMEAVKHQQQQQARRRTFVEEAAALWRQAGIKGFYRGCGITVLRSGPSSAFIFMVFDGLKRHLPMQ